MSSDERFVKILKLIDNVNYHDFEKDEISKAYTFVNPFSLRLLCESDVEIEQFDKIFIDGGLLKKIVNLSLKKDLNRYSFDFTSLANVIFKYAEDESLRLSVIGSDVLSNEKFVEKIKKKYPELVLTYSRDGYFSENEYEKIINDLDLAKPDIILLGLGTPKQDKFSLHLKKKLSGKLIFTCGGFIHQYSNTKNESYYPNILNKLNLRFLYRIFDEPKLIKRYSVIYPQSLIWYFVKFMKNKRVLKNAK